MKEKLLSRHIRLPAQITEILNTEAEEYGYKLNEWIRIILTERAFKKSSEINSVRDIARKIVKRIKNKNTNEIPHLRNEKEIDDFIDSLKKD